MPPSSFTHTGRTGPPWASAITRAGTCMPDRAGPEVIEPTVAPGEGEIMPGTPFSFGPGDERQLAGQLFNRAWEPLERQDHRRRGPGNSRRRSGQPGPTARGTPGRPGLRRVGWPGQPICDALAWTFESS